MSAKWYPEGYSYPTMPPNFGNSPATSSSGTSYGHQPSPSRVTVTRRDGAAGRSGYYDRSIKSTSAHTSVLGHPPLDSTAGRPELIPGVDYFKIGEVVHIRRYHTDKKAYSDWLPGTVIRPVFNSGCGGNNRSYLVSYIDPYTQEVKEKTFAPLLNEIAEIAPERPSSSCSDRTSKASKNSAFKIARLNTVIYARVKLPHWNTAGTQEPKRVWVPALPLAPPGVHGLHIRVLAGKAAHQEFSGVTEILPYSIHPKLLPSVGNKDISWKAMG